MEILEINEIAVLGELMHDIACEETSTVTAVLFYDTAQELAKQMLGYDDIEIGNIDFFEADNREKEFYVTLDCNMVLFVKPAFNDLCYEKADTEVLFLDGDANSRLAIINSDGLQFELDLKNRAKPVTKQLEETEFDVFKAIIGLFGAL